MEMEEVVVCNLGRVPYEPTWKLQKQIQHMLVQAKRAEPPLPTPHVWLLVEHPPVYTLGKSGKADHLLISESALAQKGAAFLRIDRGGDITFHGPGQLVGYPILDLDRLEPDIHLYLRNLERMIIDVCGMYQVSGKRVEGRTGVWVEDDAGGPERKICAMGIRCSRWVTMHGFAFNLNTDLSYFDHIVPCGISNREVTSLARETGCPVDEKAVATQVIHAFSDVFNVRIRTLESRQSIEFLETFVGQSVELDHV